MGYDCMKRFPYNGTVEACEDVLHLPNVKPMLALVVEVTCLR